MPASTTAHQLAVMISHLIHWMLAHTTALWIFSGNFIPSSRNVRVPRRLPAGPDIAITVSEYVVCGGLRIFRLILFPTNKYENILLLFVLNSWRIDVIQPSRPPPAPKTYEWANDTHVIKIKAFEIRWSASTQKLEIAREFSEFFFIPERVSCIVDVNGVRFSLQTQSGSCFSSPFATAKGYAPTIVHTDTWATGSESTNNR